MIVDIVNKKFNELRDEMFDIQDFIFNTYGLMSASTYIQIIKKDDQFKLDLFPSSIISDTQKNTLQTPLKNPIIIVNNLSRHINGFTIFTDNVILIEIEFCTPKTRDFFNTYFEKYVNHTFSIKTPNNGINLYFKLSVRQINLMQNVLTLINLNGIDGINVKHRGGVGFFLKMITNGSYNIINKPDKLTKLPTNIEDIIFKHIKYRKQIDNSVNLDMSFTNVVKEFMNTYCIFHKDASIIRNDLYNLFLLNHADYKHVNNKRFFGELRAIGINVDKKVKRNFCIENYIIKQDFVPNNKL